MGRKDAKLVGNLDSMHVIVPLLYPGRCDNEAYISERIDLTNINAYLKEKNDRLAEKTGTLWTPSMRRSAGRSTAAEARKRTGLPKITANDGKQYKTDCLSQQGVNAILMRLPGKARPQFSEWLKGLSDPIDEQSKKKAYGLYENSILDTVETGTIKG